MTDPTPFQSATVHAACKALRKKKGKPRFLVADEVGLGKTVVAQRVIEKLAADKQGPLVVYYVCSSLTIASQNARKLVEALVSDDDIAGAICTADRLSMLPFGERPRHPRLHLYTLTPDTSLPGRSGRRRDGRKGERALIWQLVEQCWPGLLPSELFQRNALSSWDDALEKADKKIATLAYSRRIGIVGLRRLFRAKVRAQFDLEPGQHLPPAVDACCDADGNYDALELIRRFRTALVECTLELTELQPDLVILDEFQRFRHLIEPTTGLDGAPRLPDSKDAVLEQLRGDRERRVPMLLLSATPYSLYSREDDEALFGSHHEQLLELLCFLYGDGPSGHQRAVEVKELFAQFGTCLRSEQLDFEAIEALKEKIERRLTTVMSRTERMRLAQVRHQSVDVQESPLPIPVDSELSDWRVFRHISERFPRPYRASAVDYWRSVPLPMQTMGSNYVAWFSANQHPRPPVLKPPSFDEEHWRLHKKVPWPHGKLRALLSHLSESNLVLPWSAPSLPWWPLDRRWKPVSQFSGKLLLFSRFRATPRSVAAALSHEARVHAAKLGNLIATSTSHLPLRADRMPTMALFHPGLWLAECCDPLQVIGKKRGQIIDHMVRCLRERLAEAGIPVKGNTTRPELWRLLAALDRQLGSSGAAAGYSMPVPEEVAEAWDSAANQPVASVSRRDLKALALHALGAPGIVLARSLVRHDPDVISTSYGLLLEVSLRAWRNYFDNSIFVAALRRKTSSYPDALREAVFSGNLESVLDEHIWYLLRAGKSTAPALLDELEQALSIRGGRVAIHDPNSADILFRAQCDVAMPLGQELEPTETPDGEAPRIRADQVRKAFNSPFWPFVLTTTSVGQEGLDFHPWCRTLLHWDLPGNPVDLEQREGRIQRYAGLSVRAEIASHLGDDVLSNLPSGVSPWTELANRVSASALPGDSGLQPWWQYRGASVKSLFFHLRSSEEKYRLELLKRQRAIYRLALGQQHQEDFVRMVVARDAETLQRLAELTPDLSAWSRQNNRAESERRRRKVSITSSI